MGNKWEKREEFEEAFEQLSPEAQNFVFNVTMGMAARHRETPGLDESLRYFTLAELEPMFSVTHRTLQTWVKDGYLAPVVKIGGKWRISEANLRKFIEEKRLKDLI